MDKPIIIAGPCVIESMEVLEVVAEKLVQLKEQYGLDIIFKSSLTKQTEHLSLRIADRDWRKVCRCLQT